MWALVGAKQKNLTPENMALGAVGDVWLWAAIDADTKLVPSWPLGDRNARTARAFMLDLASRLNSRVQIGERRPRCLPACDRRCLRTRNRLCVASKALRRKPANRRSAILPRNASAANVKS